MILNEKAHKLQVELTMIQQREKQLRERRDDLERRLLGLWKFLLTSDKRFRACRV
jgi:two-component system sensor histidine kinase DegS